MTENAIYNRCRLVLIAPDLDDDKLIDAMKDAIEGGDVASIIMPQYGRDDANFLHTAKVINEMAHEKEIATLIVDNSQVMGRSGADGLHFSGGVDQLREMLPSHSDKHMLGVGGLLDRHRALNMGECQPDYIMFGKIKGDIKPQAHPKNIALGEWWASLVEIPAVVMGGQALDSIIDIAKTRVEFVALNSAIFNNTISPSEAVAKANELLDAHGPDLDEEV